MSITLVVHGDAGVGKSWLGDTAPGPRLILDVEGGTRFTHSRKVVWNPREEPPTDLGPDDSALVRILEFGQLSLVVQWLRSGQHPFKSVVLDSVTEAQSRCMATITGPRMAETQDWGNLLIQMSDLVVNLKDLVDHPTNPMEAVVIIAGSQDKGGKVRPYVQGQLQLRLPFYVDVLGYLGVRADEAGNLQRVLLIQPQPPFDAKDRTDILTRTFGNTIIDPTIPKLLAALDAA